MGMTMYEVKIKGRDPGIIMHNGQAGLDTKSPQNREKLEITRKKASNRTDADTDRLEELETEISLWLDRDGAPTIPGTAVRACIENAARSMKQGPKVRGGLVVDSIVEFAYDKDRYGTTVEELSQTTRRKDTVVVQRSRIIRTRAEFETPWSLTFRLDCDDDLIDMDDLRTWLKIAGSRVGLGDWRPEKSGAHGKFEVESIGAIDA